MTVSVYLSIGSNIDRTHHVGAALDRLACLFAPLCLSSVYESESVGFRGSAFFNMVVGFETDLPLVELSQQLKQIEDEHGRVRGGPRFAPRTLDIDILTYADLVGDFAGIHLPRAEILYNAFVLWPLAEIAADERHPETQQTYGQLWQAYDKTRQILQPIPFMWRGRQLSQGLLVPSDSAELSRR